jgi:hypothetical protein
VFTWLKATHVEVVEESANSVVVRPVFSTGQVGTEAIAAEVSAGTRLPTRVRLRVQLNAKPGTMNLNALGSIVKLMQQIGAADTSWRPI